jgi:hypothetical protein
VLGGRAMEIVRDMDHLNRYIREAVVVSGTSPVLLDSYLSGATEVDVDALCDGKTVHVAGIMQHIEEAGVHSGDSACCLPPHTLSREVQDEILRQTRALALALNVVGLMNVQFAVKANDAGEQEVYLIEVNPRASRTVPFVAKATDSAIASIAARLMAGEPLTNFPLRPPYENVSYDTPLPYADPMTLADPNMPWFSVKEAVLPFARFPGVDTILGPEMRSTGEVMGWDRSFARAFLKAQMGAGVALPDREGRVFISVKRRGQDGGHGRKPRRSLSTWRRWARPSSPRAARPDFLERRRAPPAMRVNKVYEGRLTHCRPAQERACRAGDEHDRGRAVGLRQPRHPRRLPFRQDPVFHHGGGGPCGGAGDAGTGRGRCGGEVAAGVTPKTAVSAGARSARRIRIEGRAETWCALAQNRFPQQSRVIG